jgi:hypothetical protein
VNRYQGKKLERARELFEQVGGMSSIGAGFEEPISLCPVSAGRSS